VDVEGYNELQIKFKQYLINYAMDWGEIIGMDITFDGGTNWQVLWEQPLGTVDIPQDEFKYYFSVPSGATEMQFAFRYEGNSYAINWWLIDDISIESVVDNDLICSSFNGSAAPVAGVAYTYSVEVLNGGKLAQADYTVKLMKEGGIELASVAGENIAFAEKSVYDLSWTPDAGEIGSSYLYAIVEFTGDEKPENNQSKNLNITVQPENIVPVSIGSGDIPVNFLPYNFFNMYSITQTIYYPEEIGMNGDTITALLYNNQFDDSLQNVHVQILMGETEQTQFNDEWVDPAVFTTVYNGMLSFDKGRNQTLITLDNPYKYNGGNLVIYSSKSYEVGYIFGPVFMSSEDTNINRSRAAETDGEAFDPMNPPTYGYSVGYYPNITLFFSTVGTSIGTVEEPNSVRLFPNPAMNILHVKSDEAILEVRMIDLLGQVVVQETGGSHQHEINVGNLNPGFYLVQVLTPKGLTTQRALVTR
ncbi:MAG: T9SS type A sorting domain-containing protein, partial [Bacteroidales bacterium]